MDVGSSERLSDAELLATARSDPEAFACFYDRYETSIVGYFLRRTGDSELAADLTAEVFAAALGAAPRYRARAPTAAAWLFTIAANALKTSLRRGRVEDQARRRLGIQRAAELEENSLQRVEALASNDQWAQELLARLPSDQREAVRARILDERSYHDIAGELETSELVIRKRVSRGLANIRLRMEKRS